METPDDAPASWAGRTFGALKAPAYRRFYVGQGLSLVGSWARSTALGWLVYDLTGSKALLGTVGLASFLPMAILVPLTGAIADRADKRRLLAWVNVALLVCSAAFAALLAADAVRASHVVVFAAVTGTLVAFETPARQAFVVEMVGKRLLHNAIALNSALFNLTLFVGPAIATGILALGGMTWVFVFDALSYVGAVVALAGMRLPDRPPTEVRVVSRIEHLTAGVRYAARDRTVRRLLGLLAVVMAFGWSYSALLPAFAKDVLGTGATGYGFLYASSGLGALAGALLVAGRAGRSPDRAIRAFLLGVSLSLLAFSVARSLVLACALRAVAGFAMIGFLSTANTTIQTSVPDALRGRVMAVWIFVWSACFPLGQQALGSAAERIGTADAVGAGGAVCLAAVLALLLSRPRRPA
jgi:MFS family permease